MRLGSHEDARCARTKAMFIALRGEQDAIKRAAAIARLDSKVWRGHTVYALTCQAEFGCGHHVQFVPERVLWALIDLTNWTCPYHPR